MSFSVNFTHTTENKNLRTDFSVLNPRVLMWISKPELILINTARFNKPWSINLYFFPKILQYLDKYLFSLDNIYSHNTPSYKFYS